MVEIEGSAGGEGKGAPKNRRDKCSRTREANEMKVKQKRKIEDAATHSQHECNKSSCGIHCAERQRKTTTKDDMAREKALLVLESDSPRWSFGVVAGGYLAAVSR